MNTPQPTQEENGHLKSCKPPYDHVVGLCEDTEPTQGGD